LSYYTIRYYIKSILWAVLLAAAVFVIRQDWNLVGVSNACAVSGIWFLCLALFRVSRNLHFFDMLIFGFKKFKQIWKNEHFLEKDMKSYADFLENRRYVNNYGEAFAAAGIMFVVSVVVLVI